MSAEDVNCLQGLGASRELDWNTVYSDALPRIYNYFRFRVGSAHDLEELTSRTFEKAWRKRERYRRDLAGFSTWLFAIARNVATDHLRTEAVRIRSLALQDDVHVLSPEEQIAQGSDIARLGTLTAGLPDHHRELLALKYGAALTNRTIAEITGFSESNVGTTLQRIVERLRSQW